MNWLFSKIVGAYVGHVQGSAAKYGGVCTWKFSQCTNPVASLIGTDQKTADGICEMLSAKWIDEHAHEGHLANWLANGKSQIDASKIRLLMQLFIIGDTMSASKMVEDSYTKGGIWRNGVHQDTATRNFLLSRGIIRRGEGWNRGWGTGAASNGAKIKVQLAQDLIASRGGTGSYRIIGIYGTGGGHCMACYTGLSDIAFFDPNFGEFWFEDKRKFPAWFTEAFFPGARYTSELGQSYELFDYAMRGAMIKAK